MIKHRAYCTLKNVHYCTSLIDTIRAHYYFNFNLMSGLSKSPIQSYLMVSDSQILANCTLSPQQPGQSCFRVWLHLCHLDWQWIKSVRSNWHCPIRELVTKFVATLIWFRFEMSCWWHRISPSFPWKIIPNQDVFHEFYFDEKLLFFCRWWCCFGSQLQLSRVI